MYTAKIIQKIQDPGTRIWCVDVEFTNGTDTFIEQVKPQDKQGFNYWLQDRLRSLNGLTELIEEDNLNQVITIEATPELTAAEKARQLWLERDAIKTQVDIAIEKGYLTGTETKVVQLNTWLKANFKPEYIGII